MEDHKTVFKRFKEQVDKSAYQKELHFTGEETDVSIRTHFLNIKRRETWSYRCNLKLDCTGDISNPDFITYKVRNLPYHGLLYTVLCQQFPAIVANDGYEICWAPNIGSNIVSEATFKINDVDWQTLNCKYFDDYHQKISMDNTLDEDLGNVAAMRDWSTNLPSYTTRFWIPWWYSLHSSKMVPLYFCGKEDNICHELHLKRNIGQLLRVRNSVTQEELEFDESYIKVLGNSNNGVTSPYQLPVPEMRGDYVFMSDMECEHNRCEESKVKYGNTVFDIDNVRSVDSDNIYTLNNTVNIKIKDMPFPVHTIHWKAVNLNAEKKNYLSNYTTNSSDHTIGSNPIKWVSLSTPNGIIIKNQEFYVGEKLLSKRNFRKVPNVAGYGCWTNASDAADPLYPKPGIKLDDAELTFRLENNEHTSSDNFRVNAQMVYTYRITVKDYPKNETERNVKGIDFEISGDL